MNFYDLLNSPLPSKSESVMEDSSSDLYTDNMNMDYNSEDNDDICPDCGRNPCICNEPNSDESNENNDSDEELTPDESQRVDDTMNTVATPILIQDELNDEESVREFVESVDSDIAVAEGFLTERTIIKFDKNAKKAQLYEVAVAACAREKKDPLYKKLETVYKMERILKGKLRKKYNSSAQKKVKEYLARAKKSKSSIISRIANKLTKKH